MCVCVCVCVHVDGSLSVEPQYWTLGPGHHVTPCNSHVTSLANHSPYNCLQMQMQVPGSQTFPTDLIVNDGFSNTTPPRLLPSRQPITETFQPTKCQLPVSFDDVISGRERAEYYGGTGGEWSDGSHQLCQYTKNSYQMTRGSSCSLAVCPMSSCSWRLEPSYRTCPQYRISRHHVTSDVTSVQCGWTGSCDLDDMMWQGKFAAHLEGL